MPTNAERRLKQALNNTASLEDLLMKFRSRYQQADREVKSAETRWLLTPTKELSEKVYVLKGFALGLKWSIAYLEDVRGKNEFDFRPETGADQSPSNQASKVEKT